MASLPQECIEAENVSQSFPYKALVLWKIVVCLTSVFLIILHASLKRQRQVHHPNTTVIYWLILPLASCDRLLWAPALLYLRVTPSTLVLCMDVAILLLCFERIWCTLRVFNYENSKAPKLMAAVLVTMTIATNIVFGSLLAPGLEWKKYFVQTTVLNPNNATVYSATMLCMTAFQVASIFLLVLIRAWNRSLARKVRQSLPLQMHQRALSMKFQVEETIRVASIFMPIVATKCTLTAISAMGLYMKGLVPAYRNASLTTQMCLYEGIQISNLLMLVTPLVLMHKSGQWSRFRRTHSSSIAASDRRLLAGANETFEDYFKRLEDLFNQPLPLKG